jgi:hypothetical protein
MIQKKEKKMVNEFLEKMQKIEKSVFKIHVVGGKFRAFFSDDNLAMIGFGDTAPEAFKAMIENYKATHEKQKTKPTKKATKKTKGEKGEKDAKHTD